MELVTELLELMATLSTPDGWIAVAVGLAVGLSAGLLVAAVMAVWLTSGTQSPRREWEPSVRIHPLEFPALIEFRDERR